MPKAKWKNFTDEEIQQFVKESCSFVAFAQKMGYSGHSGSAQEALKQMLNNKNIDYSHFKGHAWNKKDDIDETKVQTKKRHKPSTEKNEFNTTSRTDIKQVLFSERGRKCECCGLSEWLNQPITIQLHHIDGDSENNIRSNLLLLCPNCHSFTDNFCKHKIQNNISDEDFLSALKSEPSICAACRALGISPNQSNYKRAYRLLNQKD